MSKINHLPKNIPPRDSEFELKEIIGALTKEAYSGKFKCKIPRLREQALIAKERAFLNAGFDATLDKQIKNLHHMVAYLKHTVTNGPEWFLDSDYGYDLYDTDVVEAIYLEVLKLEEAWLNTVWGKDESNSKT